MANDVLNVFKVGSATLGAMLATVVGLPILTRLYEPSVFSAWIVFFSIFVIFSTVATLRLELAMVLPEDNHKAATILVVCCFSSVLVSLMAWLFVYLIPHLFFGKFHLDLDPYLAALPLWICFAGIFQASMSWFTRNEMFGWYAIGQFALPVFTIGLQLAFAGVSNSSHSGLIFGAVAAQTFVAVLLFTVVIFRSGSLISSSLSIRDGLQAVREYRVYPTYMTTYSLLATIRDRFVYFLIGNYSAKETAGLYGLSQRFINIPNRLASSALRPVFFQKSAKIGFDKMVDEVYMALNLVTFAIIPIWTIMLLHANDLFALAFGENWRFAGIYGILLSIPAVPLLIGNWLDRGFDVLGRQRTAFGLEIVFSLVAVGGLCVGVFVLNDVVLGITIQVIVLAVYYWVWLGTLLRIGDYPMSGFWRLFGLYCGQTLLCLGAGFLIKAAMPWTFAVIVCFAVFYLPVCFGVYLQRHRIKELFGRKSFSLRIEFVYAAALGRSGQIPKPI